MDNLYTKVILSWVLLSTVFFVIVNSLETDDQFENIHQHADSQGKREIIEIKIPRRYKRSVDSSIRFPLRAFGRDINLNLRQTTGILFSSKTPVYFVKTRRSRTFIDTKYNMFNSSVLSKLYVDEEKKAAFTLRTDPTDGSTKIQYGFIGTENLVIDQLKPDAFLDSRSDISYNQDHYVATSIADEMSNAVSDIIGVGVNRRHPVKASTRIPETIYPEILIIVDYAVYSHFKEHGIIQYLIQFWNGVDLYYRPLRSPKFKLSIAGVIIAQDEHVFDFLSPMSLWREQGLIKYFSVLPRMSSWLQRARNSIPFNTYDTHMVMTPYRAITEEPRVIDKPSGVIGVAPISSACNGVNGGYPLGGVVYEPLNLQGILTAVHELGHVFGADHDKNWPCSTHSIMAPSDVPGNEYWSRCSIDSFHRNLITQDFTCMYNEPDLDNDDAGSDDNPPTVNTQIPNDPNHNNGQPPAVFHVEITDDRDQLTVGPTEFSPNRQVWIYYRNNKLVITQQNTNESPPSTDSNTIKPDFQVRGPDHTMIVMDPSQVNPSKLIYIYHEDGYIYAYQGSKPSLEQRDAWPKGNYTPSCFVREHFLLNKLVLIYCTKSDKIIYVSQINTPDNPFMNDPPPLFDLEYTVSDTKSIHIAPNHIKPDHVLCVWQMNGLMYIRSGTPLRPHQ